MSNVLVMNASPRAGMSISRRLTELFVARWKEKHTQDTIVYREIGQGNIPHVSEEWIAGAFKPAELRTEADMAALQISNTLVGELKEADVIVLGTPMYNWSIPSTLKAYIDQVIRVNETILINGSTPEKPYTGLLKGKQVYLLIARGNGGYEPGEYNEHLNFQTNYLKTVFNIMGIDHITEIVVNGADFQKDQLEEALQSTQQKIEELI